ncbi:MAG: rRNA maturation protein Nop10 [Candidatus Woesearchaeota archaeon]|jgi:rRNA maturation protein Nop10
MKKIYQRSDGTYTFDEYTDKKLNKTVIPPKFSPQDKLGEYRRRAKKLQND